MRRVYAKIDRDVKKGGNQSREQDPRVHRCTWNSSPWHTMLEKYFV
jgi:hypothetical protein